MTDPQKIKPLIKFAGSALELNLITKEELIDWADKIVTEDDTPDIFFIDLLLMNTKDKKFILAHFSSFLVFDEVDYYGGPLLSQLNKYFLSGKIGLETAAHKLGHLLFYTQVTFNEKCIMYDLDESFELASEDILGTLEDFRVRLTSFLSIYQGYSLYNFEKWAELDEAVDTKLRNLTF